jgi:hypothetical protein
MLKRTFAIVTALSLAMATSGYAFASTGTSGSVDTRSNHTVITVASKDNGGKDHGRNDSSTDKSSPDKGSNDKGSPDNVSPDHGSNGSNDKVIIDG